MFIAFFFIIVFYLVINLLIGLRIYKSFFASKKINKRLFIWIYIFLSITFFIYQIIKDFVPKIIDKILALIGSYYLGAFFYLSLLFSISFFFSLLIRRKYPKIDLYKLCTIIVVLLLIIGTFFSNSTHIKNYDISVDKKLKNGNLRIALVSDIHLGDIIGSNRLNLMVNSINELNPDIVIIAGDLIDSDIRPIIRDNMLYSLSNIKSTYGTYFSFGNHEQYGNKPEEISSLVSSENVITLRDKSVLVNDDFYIIGRDDSASSSSNSLSDLAKDLDTTKTKILIDHTPSRIDESIDNDIDLQVSGHTHDGQIFPANIITNNIFKVDYGYAKFNSTNIVVSSGFGTWGPPIRIGSRSEIVLINLHN